MKDIEHVVKNTTNTWKNIYLLHKKSDFPIYVSDNDEEDDGEGEKEEEIEKVTLDDGEEEQEQKATEEELSELQSIEETGPKKIAIVVIDSLPHSSSESLKISSLKKATIELVLSNIASSSTQ